MSLTLWLCTNSSVALDCTSASQWSRYGTLDVPHKDPSLTTTERIDSMLVEQMEIHQQLAPSSSIGRGLRQVLHYFTVLESS